MPVLNHGYLTKVCYQIFRALGTPKEEARIVSTHVVKANLVGHDSHGVIQVPVYTERINMGHIVPGAPFEVLDDTPATARINGKEMGRTEGCFSRTGTPA